MFERIKKFFGSKRSYKKSSLSKPKKWLQKVFAGQQTNSGTRVSKQNSLEATAVWSCVRILSEDIASLPLKTYRRLDDGGKEPATDHYLYRTLKEMANPNMSAFTFRETLMAHILTWGNGYAEIEYDNGGRVKNLWPLLPHRTKPRRNERGELWYITKIPGKGKVQLPENRVLHVHGLGYNGLIGYSPIAMHRESVGLSKAAEEFGQRFFGNDSQPGGVLKTEQSLTDKAHDNLKKSWEQKHQGLENAHRVAILEEGLEWQQIGIPPEDSQYIETRKFQNHEIARIYRMPPHMIAEMENATFSNIEEQSISYVVRTLRPWLVRWEQEINNSLFGKTNNNYFAEHLVEGLLRGDIESRYNAYAVGRNWGWLSANDVREKENMNPIENGDIYLVPQNMQPADMVREMDERNYDPPSELRDVWEKKKEIVEQRSARDRLNEEEKYEPAIKNKIQDIVDRETSNIMRNLNRIFDREQNSAEQRNQIEQWRTWLDDYYRDFPDYIKREMQPIFEELGLSVAELAADEVDFDDLSDEEIEEFVKEYTEAYAARHVDSSKGQLVALTNEIEQTEEDIAPAVEQRVNEWEDRRANKHARDETVQLGNAVARTTFASAGITKLLWQNASGDPCAFCQELDGKVVGIDQDFVPAGESLEAEEEDHNMKVYKPSSHPPIHQSCQCQIVPE